MQLIFQCGIEVLKMVIDRTNKVLQGSSSNTGNQLQTLPWKSLFDPGKEIEQEEITDKLNDEDFKKVIIASMAKVGYTLKLEE